MFHVIEKAILEGQLVKAFAFIGLVIWISNFIGRHFTGGRVAGSTIAVLAGLALAWVGGMISGQSKGLACLGLPSCFSPARRCLGNANTSEHRAFSHVHDA